MPPCIDLHKIEVYFLFTGSLRGTQKLSAENWVSVIWTSTLILERGSNTMKTLWTESFIGQNPSNAMGKKRNYHIVKSEWMVKFTTTILMEGSILVAGNLINLPLFNVEREIWSRENIGVEFGFLSRILNRSCFMITFMMLSILIQPYIELNLFFNMSR